MNLPMILLYICIVKRDRKIEFKCAVLRLKTDLLSHSTCVIVKGASGGVTVSKLD